MAPADPRSDEALVLSVAAGDPGAADRFRTRQAALLDEVCASVSPDARACAEALRDLAAVDLATILDGYDARGRWRTFVSAALLERFLFPRLLARLARDAAAHAAEFEAFFRRDVIRVVRATMEGRELREDAAQWIWEQLLDDGCRQLAIFAEQARTPGFVVVKLKRLAQDFLNSRAAPAEGRKRTLPEALADAPAFDQDVFKQFYWRRSPSAAIALLALRQRHPDATEETVRAARVRVEARLGGQLGALVGERRPISLVREDEDGKVTTIDVAAPDQPAPFAEVEQAAFRKALLLAAKGLSDREKLCLMKRLQGKAAGEIARELGLPNGEAYELMRKVVDKLRKALVANPAARERIATVTGKDSYLDPPAGSAVPRSRAPKGAAP